MGQGGQGLSDRLNVRFEDLRLDDRLQFDRLLYRMDDRLHEWLVEMFWERIGFGREIELEVRWHKVICVLK